MKKITDEELTYIEELKDRIIQKHVAKMDADYKNNELVGLYQDIIRETSKKGKPTIIFDYAKLLEEELQLYSFKSAYLYGKNNNAPYKKAVTGYLSLVDEKINDLNLTARQQYFFNEIHGLLEDAHSLITEFMETYRIVNGVAEQYTEMFIALGIQSKMKLFFIQQE